MKSNVCIKKWYIMNNLSLCWLLVWEMPFV